MSTEPQITQQERKLLDFIAKGEANKKGDPYASVYPSSSEPRLPQMTLDQVRQYQSQRLRAGFKSSAVGRYQFISSTLEEVIKKSGLSRDTRFSSSVQDFLILVRLKVTRGLEEWKAGTLQYRSPNNDISFQIKLAQEFASIPVPIPTQGAKIYLSKGQSYYAGDGLNSAHHNAEVCLRELATIRGAGPGEIEQLLIEAGEAVALPPEGSSAYTQAQIRAGGGQTVYGSYANFGASGLSATTLPEANAPYEYELIDSLDNRYDFRTGKKIYELWQNGTSSAASFGMQSSNGRPPVNDVGRTNYTTEEQEVINSNIDPDTNDPRGPSQIPGVTPITQNVDPDATDPRGKQQLPVSSQTSPLESTPTPLPDNSFSSAPPAPDSEPEEVEENITFSEDDYKATLPSSDKNPAVRIVNSDGNSVTTLLAQGDGFVLEGVTFVVESITPDGTVNVKSEGGESLTFTQQYI
jgi:hypothetical protein